MSLALDDAGRGSDPLLSRLRELTDVVAQQNATIAALRIERDTVRSEHQAAQAEIEKLRLLIRQLQRNRFGRRSEPGLFGSGAERFVRWGVAEGPAARLGR